MNEADRKTSTCSKSADDFSDRSGCLRPLDQLGEPAQHLRGSYARITAGPQIDRGLTGSLERFTIERPRLVKGSPVAPVAGVEAALAHKVIQRHALRRHASKSRAKLGDAEHACAPEGEI